VSPPRPRCVVTHVHLDTAAGLGRGRASPTRPSSSTRRAAISQTLPVIDSAARVYGPCWRSLWSMRPFLRTACCPRPTSGPPISVCAARLIESPGHAKHHQAVLDEDSAPFWSATQSGTAPRDRRPPPATPPPDFDLEQSVASLHRFRDLHPARLVLTHYRPGSGSRVRPARARRRSAVGGERHDGQSAMRGSGLRGGRRPAKPTHPICDVPQDVVAARVLNGCAATPPDRPIPGAPCEPGRSGDRGAELHRTSADAALESTATHHRPAADRPAPRSGARGVILAALSGPCVEGAAWSIYQH